MTALSILKAQLESILNQEELSEDFKQALRDAVNACNLNSVAALEGWISIWVETDSHVLTEKEIEYEQGVQLVEDNWHAITGMF